MQKDAIKAINQFAERSGCTSREAFLATRIFFHAIFAASVSGAHVKGHPRGQAGSSSA